MTSLRQHFDLFCEVNKRSKYPRDVLFMLYLVDAVVQGIKPASATTYGRTLQCSFSREGEPLSSPLVKDTFDMLELLAAEDESEHARDITVEEAWALVRILQTLSPAAGRC